MMTKFQKKCQNSEVVFKMEENNKSRMIKIIYDEINDSVFSKSTTTTLDF